MSQTQATLKQKERKARTSLLNARRREQVIIKAEIGTDSRLAGPMRIEMRLYSCIGICLPSYTDLAQ
jgi:hypothetical protein